MWKFIKYFTAVLYLFVFISCGEGLKKKQQEVHEREIALLEKEKNFALKEAEYHKLLQMKDSLISQKDSIAVKRLPVDITGKWNGKMICTDSNCTDYVVGDVRVDEWEITQDKGVLIAKNVNKTGVVRVYNGSYDGTRIHFTSQSEPEAPNLRIFKIELGTITANRLAGSREIQVDNTCSSIFSVELLR